MTIHRIACTTLVLTALLWLGAPRAEAQPQFELGTSLAGAFVGLGDDNDVTSFGLPSAGFGIIDSGVYGSLFLGNRFAIEPRIGFVRLSLDGEASHVLNVSGQANYYFTGTEQRSLYVFGAAGLFDMTDNDETPKTVGGGLGYRLPVGDRLVFRIDGRYLRFMEDAGDSDQLLFTVSIGGLLGR